MRKSQKTAVVGASVIAIVGGGIAFAAWTSTGEGTGTVTAGSEADLVVSQLAGTTVEGLFPTGDKDISFTVENENPYSVKVSSLVPSVSAVSGGNCSLTNSLVTADRVTDVNNTIPAGGSADYVVNVAMGADSDDACQGAVFTIKAVATGASAPAA